MNKGTTNIETLATLLSHGIQIQSTPFIEGLKDKDGNEISCVRLEKTYYVTPSLWEKIKAEARRK